MKKNHLSDLEIAQRATPLPIQQIADKLALPEEDLHLYGKSMAKISLDVLQRLNNKPNGKYILVTCINPTPLGEGKTVNTIGLSMGLNKSGKTAVCCIRQPSMGPTFGIKGGAAGGGYSQVLPMEDFNLHFTGDFHAVTAAHNLLASFIDNSIHHNNPLNIDSRSVSWKRVMDISDRALRQIIIGLGGKKGGVPRETGFDITAASEVMTILSLTNDLKDLHQRLSRILIGYNDQGQPITAGDLKCAGAMTVLLKDAIQPNLIQTLEHTPCFVHTGPFGNISTGNSSILADKIALKCADFVVTESGFGADMGAEKFVNIKCHYSGLKPDAALLVCSIRALKMHGGSYHVKPGKPLPPGLLEENLPDLQNGLANLEKQIENVLIYNIPVVVAVNRFETDTEMEIKIVLEAAKKAGAHSAVVSEVFAKGGEGALEMADAIIKASDNSCCFTPLYKEDIPIKDKIETIARRIYGASRCIFTPLSERKIDKFTELGFHKFPICMAKTHLSLSHNPDWKNRPRDFETPVQNIEAAAGAGYLYALLGEIMTMPGLPTIPGGAQVDIDDKGKIVGLF